MAWWGRFDSDACANTRSHPIRSDPTQQGAELPELVKQAEEERKRAARLRNPGGFEKIIEEGKKLSTVDCFEGFRCVVCPMPLSFWAPGWAGS